MSKHRLEQQLALNGGMKAVTRIAGKGQPKIGVDEFISVAERFGFSAAALAQFRAVAEAEALGDGPFLANYYSNLKETKVQAFERLARQWAGLQVMLALLHSAVGEHAARVLAMENASGNLRSLESELTLLRNRARQAAITKELSEVVGGAEALA